MRTTDEQDDILYALLKGSALDQATTGGVYFNERPKGSNLEDVVINSVAIVPGSVSLGVSNVNIHVADLDNGQPNQKRLKVLKRLAAELLEFQNGGDYTLETESSGDYKAEGQNSYYANFRIKFQFMG